MTISCCTTCRDEVPCGKWALVRSDGTKYRQVTEIVEVVMGARHEPDVPAPDTVPNTVSQALPLLRNGSEGSTWAPGPNRLSSIRKGMSIRQKQQPPTL